MAFIIILCLIVGGAVVYFFLNPAEKIKENEQRELDTLDAGYGTEIENAFSAGNIHSAVVERYYYLKHKYNLTKKQNKK
jgi:hypothetical protein